MRQDDSGFGTGGAPMSAGDNRDWLRNLEKLLNFIDEFQSTMLHHREFTRIARLAFNSVNYANALLNHDRRSFPLNVDAELAEARNLFTHGLVRIEGRTGQSLEYWATAPMDDSQDLDNLSEILRIIGDELYKPIHLLERAARDASPYLKPLDEATVKPESPPIRGTRKLLDKYFKDMTLEKRTELLEKSQKEVLDHLEDNGFKTSDRTLRATEAWTAKQVRERQTKNENKRELENKRFYG